MNPSRALLLIPALIGLFLSGCHGTSSQKAQESEMVLHKVRSELETIRGDLGSYQMELNILEGRMLGHEDAFAQLREETLQKALVRLEKLSAFGSQLEKRLLQLEKKQDETLSQMKQMSNLAQDASKMALLQRERTLQLEEQMRQQKEIFSEVSLIRKELLSLMGPSKERCASYKVKPGDTLEKIARECKTTVDRLRKVNELKDDRILAGDDLLIPQDSSAA